MMVGSLIPAPIQPRFHGIGGKDGSQDGSLAGMVQDMLINHQYPDSGLFWGRML